MEMYNVWWIFRCGVFRYELDSFLSKIWLGYNYCYI